MGKIIGLDSMIGPLNTGGLLHYSGPHIYGRPSNLGRVNNYVSPSKQVRLRKHNRHDELVRLRNQGEYGESVRLF